VRGGERGSKEEHDNKIESKKLQIAINEVHSSSVTRGEMKNGTDQNKRSCGVNIHFVLRLLHLPRRYKTATKYRDDRARN